MPYIKWDEKTEKFVEIPWEDIPEPPPIDPEELLPPEDVTWENLVEVEPRLRALERDVQTVADKGGPSFCANAIWYGYLDPEFGFKERMTRYMGWIAEVPELRSIEAYDLAYEHLYDLLPDCRNCTCF